jgi:hypothetical protein
MYSRKKLTKFKKRVQKSLLIFNSYFSKKSFPFLRTSSIFFIPILSSTPFYLSSHARNFCNLEIHCCDIWFCYYFLFFCCFLHFTFLSICIRCFLFLSCTKFYFILPFLKMLANFCYCLHFLS